MKRKAIIKFLSTVWILMFLFSSCNDINLANISNDLKIDESLVIPIGEGSASIGDILSKVVNDSNLFIDADTINYVSNYTYDYSFKPIDILQYAVPRKIVIDGFVPVTINANSAVQLPGTSNYTVDLGLDPASTSKRVDSTYVSSTAIGITVTASNITVASNGSAIVPSDLKVTLGFPKIYNQGNRSPVNVPVPYSFGTEYGLQLNNVIVDTHGQTGVPVTVSLTSGNRPIKVNASSVINININFNKVNFSVCYGLFQPSSVQTTTIVLPLEMLQALPKGMTFANPKAFINIKSNIGSWLDYNIDFVQAYNKNKTIIKNAHFVNGSTSTSETIKAIPSSPGAFSSWNLKTLDKNYGTTNQLFETNDVLDTLKYQFSLKANPNSPAPSFVIPGMKMTANVKIQIPMYLEKGSAYNYSDTIQYSNNGISNVDQGILVLKITNGLPVQAKFTVKLLDVNNQLIHSSLNDSIYIIKSGNVDANGLVTSSTVTNLNINLTSTQLTDLKNAKAFAYTILLSGQDINKAIQFTKNDLIKVKLGVFITGSINTTNTSTNN